MPKTKIGFLIEHMNIKNGRSAVVQLLSNELIQDFDIYLILIEHRSSPLVYTLDPRIKVCYLTDSYTRIRDVLMTARKPLRKILHDNNIEILLSIGVSTFLLGNLGTLLNNTKLIACEHSSLKYGYGKVSTFAQYLAVKRAAQVVVLTKRDLKNYQDKFHLNNQRIKQIYNPIDPELLKISTSYDNHSKKIITVTRIEAVKCVDRAILASKILMDRCPGWCWEIYGEYADEDMKQYKALMQELAVEKFIKFMGPTNTPSDAYRSAAIYCLTSRNEGFPMVLLEAKMHHLPIVSFDIDTGPDEMIEDGINGYLANNGDIEDLADKLLMLMENQERRVSFSKQSQLNIDDFEIAKITNEWKQLLKKVVDNK